MPHFADTYSTEEAVSVRAAYSDLLASLKPKLKGDDEINLNKAFELAFDAHQFQRRKSGEPYIFHPIEVARIAHEEMGLGPTAVICAIMHDVVEDTPINLEEISDIFGPKITQIVDGLTKLDGLYNLGNQNAENLKKVLSTLVNDVRVVLIKMADRLHNLRTIAPMPQHKKLKIAAETMFIYAPLAHRLGVYGIKTEFEDICMMITDEENYNALQKKIKDNEEQRSIYLKSFLKPLQAPITELKVPYRILARPKAISSIWNKIKTKNIEFEEIYDLFAVRVIVDVPRNLEKSICWQIYSAITDHYKPIPERLKDWITSPKGNGYESLHTTVIGPSGRYVEVQIRSERMNDIAERGFAAHWKYKGVKNNDNVYEHWLDNIRNLLETQEGDALEFLSDFKTNLFSEEVYVFTPNGDMRILPKGATALDFAFDIHSDVGAKATAIKVNSKLVPMGHVLENGDKVTVTTSKNQTPSENWLKLVITGKARSKIRSSINEKTKVLSDLGKEALIRKLKNLKVDYDQNVDFLISHFKFKNKKDLFLAINSEEIKLAEFSKLFIVENGELKPFQEKKVQIQQQANSATTPGTIGKEVLIKINDEPADNFQFELSACCNPVPGDRIFAFLTSNAGMKIHRMSCANASNLFTNYGYRILKADWTSQSSRDFMVEIKITGIDSGPGVIQTLTNEISNNLNINIRSFAIEGDEGIYEGRLKIVVKDKNQLMLVMKSLKELENISTVERIST